MTKVIIDCDPGHDDVFAIGLAARHLEIVGLTTVCGNSTIENTTRNALIARDLFSLDGVPVVVGAGVPLDGKEPRFTTAHGSTGLDGPVGRSPLRPPDRDQAHEFLIEQSKVHDDLWIVAIGPLTNIAKAIEEDQGFAKRIGGISIMGGSASFGNVTTASEYNTWFDPIAADVVFRSSSHLKLCGLNVTHQFAVGPSFGRSLRAIKSDKSVFCSDLFDFYFSYSAEIFSQNPMWSGEVLAPLHDPCAVLALTHPEIFQSEFVNVQIEIAGSLTRGMTVVERRPWMVSQSANVELLTSIDAGYAERILIDAFM